MSLIAAEVERQGIPTVTIQLLREIAEKVHAPRALLVPFRHGYPLGEPNNPALQRRVIDAALRLFEDRSLTPPVIAEFHS